MVRNPIVDGFHDAVTGTVSYVVHAGRGTPCAVIDPVLDFDPKSGRRATRSVDRLVAHVRELGLAVAWILETHAHADHLSGAQLVRAALGGRIAIGEGIRAVQATFAGIFHLGDDFPVDGSQFDRLLAEGDAVGFGDLRAEVIATPGHTPACVSYRVGDAVFTGDTLFMPDAGTARCDFPGGDARTLYRSIRRLLALPPGTRLFACHDYPPPGREPQWQSTVAEQRAGNIHVHDGIDEEAFVAMRTQRDATLAVPVLMLPSLQVNIRAGALPPPESDGRHYLKLPVDAL